MFLNLTNIAREKNKKKLIIISMVTIAALSYLYLCFSIFKKTTVFHSDFAALVLWANDILHGNVFLRDWHGFSTIFLTTDFLFYLLGSIVFGIHVNTFYVAITLMFFTFSLSSLLLYKWQDFKTNAMNILIWLSVGALPIGILQQLLFHFAVWIYVFIACFFIDKIYHQEDVPSNKNRYFIIIAVCLILGTIGDLLILVGFILPVFIVCLYLWLTEPGKSNFCIKLTLTSAFALIVGIFLQKLYYSNITGKYSFSSINFKSLYDIPNSIIIYLDGLLHLFDANFTGKPLLHYNNILYCFRLIVILIGFYIVIINIVRFFKGKTEDIVSVILSLGFVFLSAVYIFAFSLDLNQIRYLSYTPILFSLLISRFFLYQKTLPANISAIKIPVRIRNFICICCSLSILGIILPIYMQGARSFYPHIKLGEFLVENELKNGYASYWDASVTTVTTGNQSIVRAIGFDGTFMIPLNWLSKNSWYDSWANFVVIGDRAWGVTEENINYSLGPPAQILTVDKFILYVYSFDISKFFYSTIHGSQSAEHFEEYLNPFYLTYELSDILDLTFRSKYQFIGWSYPEEWGTWTDNDKVELAFCINNYIDLVLHLNITAVFNNNPVDVYVNNILIGSFNFIIGENLIQIPKSIYPEQIVKIRFEFNDLQSPLGLGLSNDVRKLGICVSSIFLTGN